MKTVELFKYEQISSFNKGEFRVYNYVSAHLKEAAEMNIRELSAAAEVSTTTVLRFCSKVECDGYTEFKYRLKKSLEEDDRGEVKNLLSPEPVLQFVQKSMKSSTLQRKLEEAARICVRAERVVFIGSSTSGYLASYGAHFFAGAGVNVTVITDMFYPLPVSSTERLAVIALSVSGETGNVIRQIDGYRKKGARVISITNTDQCTVAKISELNFPYYMPLAYASQEDDVWTSLTTQVPVVYLIEAMTSKVYAELRKQTEAP